MILMIREIKRIIKVLESKGISIDHLIIENGMPISSVKKQVMDTILNIIPIEKHEELRKRFEYGLIDNTAEYIETLITEVMNE